MTQEAPRRPRPGRGGRGRERLLLARDPLGIKPLLYSGDANRLIFASEMKAILASGYSLDELSSSMM